MDSEENGKIRLHTAVDLCKHISNWAFVLQSAA